MYIYQLELANGKSVEVKAAKHKQTGEGSFVFYGQDDEVVGEYKNVESWSMDKMKEVKFFAL